MIELITRVIINVVLAASGAILLSLGTNWKVGLGALLLAVYIKPSR